MARGSLRLEENCAAGVSHVTMLEVVQAEYVEGYKLKLSFSTGERGVVDLADALWGPVFAPLRNVGQFQKMLEQAQAGAFVRRQ
jgi:hypothetical protein